MAFLDDRCAGKTLRRKLCCITIRSRGDVRLQPDSARLMSECPNELLRWTEDSLGSLNIESHHALRGRLHLGRELGSAIEQRVLCRSLLLRYSFPQNNVRALGRLCLCDSWIDPGKLRALIASDDPRQRLGPIENSNWPVAPCLPFLFGLATERCLHNKARHEDAGEKHD